MASTLTIQCIRPGGGAYVVDGGRPESRHLGVASGGPADGRAMRAANHLLNRSATATCLEMTLAAGEWLLSGKGQIAMTGADMNWRLNGQLIYPHSVLYIDGDALLTGTTTRRGMRSYLAIRGDWDLPTRLGSRETGLPGIPAVSQGWSARISAQGEAPFQSDLETDRFWPEEVTVLPVIPGPEFAMLSAEVRKWLLKTPFLVDRDSNRQGIRLKAGSLPPEAIPNLISSPVLPGTVQLSPMGPILLGPNAQTVGGYPRALLVADSDALSAAFQQGIDEEIRFNLVAEG